MTKPIGTSLFAQQLRYWRKTRNVTQLALALAAETTARHVSFLENGRSRPSEQMVRRLAAALDIPIREQNALLTAAGFAPAFQHRELADTALSVYRRALAHMLRSNEPYPAVVIDRYYDILQANQAAVKFFLLSPNKVTNVVTKALDPQIRSTFTNWDEVGQAFAHRLRCDLANAPNDPRLCELVRFTEQQLPSSSAKRVDEFLLCPNYRVDGREIRLMGMIASFSTAREVTLNELRVEVFCPRDDETKQFFVELAAKRRKSKSSRLPSTVTWGCLRSVRQVKESR